MFLLFKYGLSIGTLWFGYMNVMFRIKQVKNLLTNIQLILYFIKGLTKKMK